MTPVQEQRHDGEDKDSDKSIDQVAWPLMHDQLDSIAQKFIDSINKEAIRVLASENNYGQDCTVAKPKRGSFNVCYVVDFHAINTKWIVRIPIEPVVHNAWYKLESEVVTLKYIRENTSIPVPTVHKYGKARGLTAADAETPFLILDYIPGQPLNMSTLLDNTEEQRRCFFSDLIDILAELRGLEFPKAGSLAPNPDGGKPIIGRVFSMALNELQISHHRRTAPSPFLSVGEFIDHRYAILSDMCHVLVCDLTHQDTELDVFALHGLEKQISGLFHESEENGVFVLDHSDLRCGNIIVDGLDIRGIIDWEWACAVPQQLHTPPAWTTGHNPNHWDRYGDVSSEFHDVLQTASSKSRLHAQLAREWASQRGAALHVAQTLHHPSTLYDIYYKFIYADSSNELFKEVVSRSCKADTALALAAREWAGISERYTSYLKDNGLYVVDAETLWLEKVRIFDEMFGEEKEIRVDGWKIKYISSRS